MTVAVRYTAIRRQFRDRDGDGTGPELAVLDYPTVQIRILPLLATTFALHYSGLAMRRVYEDARNNIERGDFSPLANMHVMSSGLKSLCTTLAADGIETCRRALGGHGFGGGSGLIQLNNDYLSKPTVEGDNWMITQQMASSLIKKMTAAVESRDTPAKDATEKSFKDFLHARNRGEKNSGYVVLNDDQAIVYAFERRAVSLVSLCSSTMKSFRGSSQVSRATSMCSRSTVLRSLPGARGQEKQVERPHDQALPAQPGYAVISSATYIYRS